TIMRRHPWGQQLAAGALPGQGQLALPPATPPQKIVGIVTRQGNDFVVATPPSGSPVPVYLKVGDAFADGSRIVAMDRVSVVIEDKAAQARTHKLFRLSGN